jgi:hypothetical protein
VKECRVDQRLKMNEPIKSDCTATNEKEVLECDWKKQLKHGISQAYILLCVVSLRIVPLVQLRVDCPQRARRAPSVAS